MNSRLLKRDLTPSESSDSLSVPNLQRARGAFASGSSSSDTPIPEGGFDMRLHGNLLEIGGCWGTVDLNAAINLTQKSRSDRPHLPLIRPLGARASNVKRVSDDEIEVYGSLGKFNISDNC